MVLVSPPKICFFLILFALTLTLTLRSHLPVHQLNLEHLPQHNQEQIDVDVPKPQTKEELSEALKALNRLSKLSLFQAVSKDTKALRSQAKMIIDLKILDDLQRKKLNKEGKKEQIQGQIKEAMQRVTEHYNLFKSLSGEATQFREKLDSLQNKIANFINLQSTLPNEVNLRDNDKKKEEELLTNDWKIKRRNKWFNEIKDKNSQEPSKLEEKKGKSERENEESTLNSEEKEKQNKNKKSENSEASENSLALESKREETKGESDSQAQVSSEVSQSQPLNTENQSEDKKQESSKISESPPSDAEKQVSSKAKDNFSTSQSKPIQAESKTSSITDSQQQYQKQDFNNQGNS